jgi:hypothetical protein
MHFKLEHVLNELAVSFKDQEPLTLAYGDDHNASVMIRPLTAEEKEQYDGEGLMCTAFTEEEPSGDLLTIFERLANNLMPEGFKKPKTTNSAFVQDEHEYIDNEGRIKEKHVAPASLFPECYQAFESQLLHKLTERIRHTVKIIRWRKAVNSSHNPVRFTLGMSWSFDGQNWQGMPASISYRMSLKLVPSCSPKLQDEIESLIKANVNEPLGHELFLEAWQNREKNPRSALIIGITAAEVGFKQCVGKLVPDAEWLATNSPSPPLVKMLSHYLPTLPTKLKIQDKVLKPPRSIRKALDEGIAARNDTTHAGIAPPKGEELEKLLLSVRDLLYLLDVYCGFEWALNNIRTEVQLEMIEEFGLKTASRKKDVETR